MSIKTGISDENEFKKVENALLKPLHSFLSSIKSTQEYSSGHGKIKFLLIFLDSDSCAEITLR